MNHNDTDSKRRREDDREEVEAVKDRIILHHERKEEIEDQLKAKCGLDEVRCSICSLF